MTPICAKCGKPMYCEKTGRAVVEYHDENTPFRLTHADEFRCKTCGAAVCIMARDAYAEFGVNATFVEIVALEEKRQNVVRVVYT